jgi:hypothetical protein
VIAGIVPETVWIWGLLIFYPPAVYSFDAVTTGFVHKERCENLEVANIQYLHLHFTELKLAFYPVDTRKTEQVALEDEAKIAALAAIHSKLEILRS